MAEPTMLYSITLAGQGDIETILVDKETWDWMLSVPKFGRADQIDERLPKEYEDRLRSDPEKYGRREEDDFLITICRSSYDNDRALGLISASENVFGSVKELTDYVIDNNIRIIETYEGYIY